MFVVIVCKFGNFKIILKKFQLQPVHVFVRTFNVFTPLRSHVGLVSRATPLNHKERGVR